MMLSLVVQLLSSSVAGAEWTTHSSLTAFKQLGFDNGGGNGGYHHSRNPQSPSYIPYSISDFSEAKKNTKGNSGKAAAAADNTEKSLLQLGHPNDILSNMGVDLPAEEILGKTLMIFIKIFLESFWDILKAFESL